jgi:redox-regulated HSP33 family molecular chaperone
MRTLISHRTLTRLAALALFAAPALHAQERALFTWNGRVDSDVRVVVHSAAINSELVSGTEMRPGRVMHVSPLPRRDGTVRVEKLAGRGTVDVVQQPSATNGYTAIFELKDADSGPDMYRFSAYFTPSGSTTSTGEVISSSTMLNHGGALLTWRGRVDKDVMITIRGDRIRTRTLDGAPPENVQANLAGGGLPAQDATLTLNQRQGRGTITITQQPSSANNYTTVIRVRDSRQGFGYYDFDIIWP